MSAPIQTQQRKNLKISEHLHPPYSAMIIEAIQSMQEKTGSSRPAILKYILANNKVDAVTAPNRVRLGIRKLSEAKKIVAGSNVAGRKGAGSFKVAAAAPGKKKIVGKKPRVKKAPKMKRTSASTTPKKVSAQKKIAATPKKKTAAKNAAVKKVAAANK